MSEEINRVTTDILDIGYETGGPHNGPLVLLLHGWPDDVRGWRGVVPHLEHAGFRWVLPWLRGFGPTRFLSVDTIRDGSAVALAQDAIDVVDHLGCTKFSVVGHDWGTRVAYTLAARFSRASLNNYCTGSLLFAAQPVPDSDIRAIPPLVVSVVHDNGPRRRGGPRRSEGLRPPTVEHVEPSRLV